MSRETSDTPSANPRMILEEQWPIRPTEQRQAAYSSRRYRHRDRRPGEDFAERSRVRLVSVCRQYRDASVSVGARATDVLYSSAMYSPAEAYAIGLVSEVVAAEALLDRAHAIARERGSHRPAAFAGIKVAALCADRRVDGAPRGSLHCRNRRHLVLGTDLVESARHHDSLGRVSTSERTRRCTAESGPRHSLFRREHDETDHA